MQYAIWVSNYGKQLTAKTIIELAVEAENSGWDAFFLWDHVVLRNSESGKYDLNLDIYDPWVLLSAIATQTKKIKLGPMVTPLPRRRPWKLARETVTLDYISNGRLIQGIGIGSPREIKSNPFGEESNPKKLARRLDEAAEILIKFWSGKPFTYNGEYYQIDEVLFSPKPLQKPRIPIWVAGTWPHKAPFKRAAKYEGVVPINSKWPKPLTPEMLRDVLSIIKENRGSLKNYDVAVSGVTSGKNTKQDRERLLSYISEGANWWIEDIYEVRGSLENLLTRIRDGPPAV